LVGEPGKCRNARSFDDPQAPKTCRGPQRASSGSTTSFGGPACRPRPNKPVPKGWWTQLRVRFDPVFRFPRLRAKKPLASSCSTSRRCRSAMAWLRSSAHRRGSTRWMVPLNRRVTVRHTFRALRGSPGRHRHRVSVKTDRRPTRPPRAPSHLRPTVSGGRKTPLCHRACGARRNFPQVTSVPPEVAPLKPSPGGRRRQDAYGVHWSPFRNSPCG